VKKEHLRRQTNRGTVKIGGAGTVVVYKPVMA
jgi:hypothetical protein